MGVIFKISYRNLIKNKRWSIPTAIAIITAVALMTGLLVVVSTYFKSSQDAIIQRDGAAHYVAFNLDESEIHYLHSQEEIESIDVIQLVSYATISDYTMLNHLTPYIKMMDIQQEEFEANAFTLKTGTYPVKDNEIALSDALHYFTNLNLTVGDKIKLKLGTRIVENEEYTNRFYNLEYEHFITDKIKEYTITGFMATTNESVGDYEDAGYVSMVHSDQVKENQNISFIQLTTPNYKNDAIITKFLDDSSIQYNKTYLMNTFFFGLDSMSKSPLYFVIIGSLLLGLLILISSILVIRNAYAINHRYLLRQIGLIDALGATFNQKVLLMLAQSFLFAIVCIPLGILLGYVSMSIILVFFSNTLSEIVFYARMKIYLYPLALILLIVVSYFVIMSTSIYPVLKLAGLSSVDSIEFYNRELEEYATVMPPSFFKKIEYRLAYINYRRGRKYYRSLTLSLITSIILISTSVLLVNANQRTQQVTRKDLVYPYYTGQIEDGKLIGIVDELQAAPHIKHAGIWSDYSITIDDITPNVNLEMVEALEHEDLMFSLQVVDDQYCTDVLENEFMNFDCENEGLFVDYFVASHLSDDNKVIKHEGPLFNQDIKQLTLNINEHQFDLLFKENELRYTSSNVEEEPTVFYSRTTFNKLGTPFINFVKEAKKFSVISQHEIFVNSDNNREALNTFRTVLSHYGIEDLSSIENISNTNFLIVQFTRFIGVISFGMAIMIVIIAISNVVNSINHSLNMRLRETSILLANGMTVDSFVKMNIIEISMFGIASLILGVPLAIVLSFILSSFLGVDANSFIVQRFTIYFVSILLVFIMMVLAVTLNVNKIRKYDITELSRE